MNDTGWRKSSISTANGQCVEVRQSGCGDTGAGLEDPDEPVRSFSRETWDAFLADIKRYAYFAGF